MKKYYIGPVEIIKVTNLKINEQAPKIMQERVILQQNVLFYQNKFNVMIRFEDKCPLATYDEALFYMDRCLTNQHQNEVYCSFPFFDIKNLTRIEITKEKEKELIKKRKEQKRKRAE